MGAVELPANARPRPMERELFIGGQWRPAADGRRFAVEDPALQQTITTVADASAQDALDALAAADRAGASWAATGPRQRSEILYGAYELLIERLDELAELMTLEMGKTLAESAAEVQYAAEFFRWFAEEAVRIHGRFMNNTTGSGRIITMAQPVGPCLLITPWNFPAAMGARKIAPALAAGCTVIVKPAQQTPLSMFAIADALIAAGLPPGVLNVITSSSAASVSDPLLDDSRLRKLSFTGSTAVGRALMAGASERLLRISMELGGNAPFIVFADADIDAAVEGAMIAKMRNIGEACTAANRFLVERSVAEQFAERLAERMSALKCGHGTDPQTEVGPLIDAAQRSKVQELVQDAEQHGARVLCGAEELSGSGYFYAPTVLADVPRHARMASEEIFGPVAPIYAFSDEQDAIELANATDYGLVAYLYTRDLDRALHVCESLQVGMVGVNQGIVSNPAAPFGGVKQSGFGREGGFEGIDEYLSVKYLALATPPLNS